MADTMNTADSAPRLDPHPPLTSPAHRSWRDISARARVQTLA